MKVIILRGLPGSGKSTCAKMLASVESDSVIVSADDHFIKDGEYIFDNGKIVEAHQRCLRNYVHAVLCRKALVLVDNTNVYIRHMAPYVALAEAYGAEIEIHFVSSGLSSLQLAERNIHGYPVSVIESMSEAFERLPHEWAIYTCGI